MKKLTLKILISIFTISSLLGINLYLNNNQLQTAKAGFLDEYEYIGYLNRDQCINYRDEYEKSQEKSSKWLSLASFIPGLGHALSLYGVASSNSTGVLYNSCRNAIDYNMGVNIYRSKKMKIMWNPNMAYYEYYYTLG